MALRIHPLVLSCIVAFGAGSGACASEAPQSTQDDIQRGESARNYPAVGMVRFKSGNFGTGTLIRPNVVLTAGHVAYGNLDRFYYGSPAAGLPPIFSNLKSVVIADKALGECYERDGHDSPSSCPGNLDIALVKLETPITDVKPVKMYDQQLLTWTLANQVMADPKAIAVGFGCHTLADNRTQVYEERRFATSIFNTITETEVVVTAGTGIASGGDSGGPLLYKGIIMGTVRGGVEVTTDGNSCGRIKEGYIRIDVAMPWITKQLSAWGAL